MTKSQKTLDLLSAISNHVPSDVLAHIKQCVEAWDDVEVLEDRAIELREGE